MTGAVAQKIPGILFCRSRRLKFDWLAPSSRDFSFEKLMFNDGKAKPDLRNEREGGKVSPLIKFSCLISHGG